MVLIHISPTSHVSFIVPSAALVQDSFTVHCIWLLWVLVQIGPGPILSGESSCFADYFSTWICLIVSSSLDGSYSYWNGYCMHRCSQLPPAPSHRLSYCGDAMFVSWGRCCWLSSAVRNTSFSLYNYYVISGALLSTCKYCFNSLYPNRFIIGSPCLRQFHNVGNIVIRPPYFCKEPSSPVNFSLTYTHSLLKKFDVIFHYQHPFWSVGAHLSWLLQHLEHFLPFWCRKMLQAHVGLSLPQTWFL